jgi:Secreted repeat of unknown function
MNVRTSLIMAIAAVTTVATMASAQMAPTKTGDSAKGKVLTNEEGMSLYVFDKDSSGKSACNEQCAGNWPPLTATASSMPMGDYTIITRDVAPSSGPLKDTRSTPGRTTKSPATSRETVYSTMRGMSLSRNKAKSASAAPLIRTIGALTP